MVAGLGVRKYENFTVFLLPDTPNSWLCHVFTCLKQFLPLSRNIFSWRVSKNCSLKLRFSTQAVIQAYLCLNLAHWTSVQVFPPQESMHIGVPYWLILPYSWLFPAIFMATGGLPSSFLYKLLLFSPTWGQFSFIFWGGDPSPNWFLGIPSSDGSSELPRY